MRKIWLVACGVAMSGAALAQFRAPPPPPLAPTEITMPPKRMAPPVPALRQTRAYDIFNSTCSGCHGQNLQPGAKAKSLFTTDYLNSHTDEQIVASISEGAGVPNHDFKRLFNPDEISQMPAYLRIVAGPLNRKVAPVPDINGKVFTSAKQKFKVETMAKGLNQPWGAAFLPDGRMIFTERDGKLRFMDKKGALSAPVKGTPAAPIPYVKVASKVPAAAVNTATAAATTKTAVAQVATTH